jgi:membrane-associated phospholipid phosphatase
MKRVIPLSFISTLLLWTSGILFAQSPYKISWEKDGYILGGGSVAAVGGLLLDRTVAPLSIDAITSLSRASVNSFDRGATYNYSESAGTASDILRNSLLAAPFVLLVDNSIRNDWKTIAVMYAEVYAFVGATNLTLKGAVKRIRPFVYNPDAPLDEKLSSDARKSFFSGHTIIAFASAVFLSTVYGDYYPESQWKPYLWAGSLALASMVGILRYEAGMHFPTDILVGAAVGSTIGYAIPWMHRVNKEELSFYPAAPTADYGFSFQIRF